MNRAVAQPDDRSTVPGSKVVGYSVAILSAATAVIHFAVTGSHFQEYWIFGVFMLVVAWMQAAWAAALVIRPSRWLIVSGAIINTAVIAVYLVTRTVGDVIGPTPNSVEPVGFGDGLCTALEAAVVIGCLWLLVTATNWRVRRVQLYAIPAATGAATGVLLSVALVAGGSEMVMTAAAGTPAQTAAKHVRPMHMSMHMSVAKTAALEIRTASPAGDVTMPDPNMQMAPGMRMASPAMCRAVPTQAQRAAAVRLVNASWKDVRRFRSLAVAKAAGYVPITPSGLPVVHYLNYKYYLATAAGGRVLNTAEPQSLVYANTAHGAVLVASMYIAPPGHSTPQPGGCLTQWHVHTNLCTTPFGQVVGLVTAASRACPPGSSNKVTPPMMHVWYVPIPGGPTAIDASDAQIVRAAGRVRSFGNGPA
jgi:hypothetical protein